MGRRPSSDPGCPPPPEPNPFCPLFPGVDHRVAPFVANDLRNRSSKNLRTGPSFRARPDAVLTAPPRQNSRRPDRTKASGHRRRRTPLDDLIGAPPPPGSLRTSHLVTPVTRKTRRRPDADPHSRSTDSREPHFEPSPQSFDDTIPAANPDPPSTATATAFFSRTRYE